MTFDELDDSLPNGLHDAELLGLDVDWVQRKAAFRFVLWVAADVDDPRGAEVYRPISSGTGWAGPDGRPATVTFTGVHFLTIDPPQTAYAAPRQDRGLRIDAASGDPPDAAPPPTLPPETFRLWMFVSDWNAFIRLAARDVQLDWTGDEVYRERTK